MAMIEKIRRQSGLLLIMIGLGLVGFLLPYNAVMKMFGRGGNSAIGEINGRSVSPEEWHDAIQKQEGLFRYSGNNS
ncbi:MAG: SurA N-terminal domain-containing protein, partial [Crocinitomicaceae bacterium]|nr:SurA N-terminal domain-containing protein [Crocinitomicaceae bacterium]